MGACSSLAHLHHAGRADDVVALQQRGGTLVARCQLLCVCVCVCVCACVCLCVHVCYTHRVCEHPVCVCVCTHTHVCASTLYVHMYIHLCLCMCVCVHACVCTYICAYICHHTYALCVFVCVYAHINAPKSALGGTECVHTVCTQSVCAYRRTELGRPRAHVCGCPAI